MQIHVHAGLVFDYVNPPPLNQRLTLLTKDNRIEFGAWRGEPPGRNKTLKAWCGCPARDMAIERELEYR